MTSDLVHLAKNIAFEAHSGQFRRDGVTPYIEHPKSVVKRIDEDDFEAQVVAWLHDVIEDSNHTEETLLEAGIPSHLVQDVVTLTKTKNTSYDEYLANVSLSKIATKVKIADMLSNISDNPTKKQIKKYSKGLLRLVK